MINFIDDATGVTYVKFFKNKSDVPKTIKEFIQETKTDIFKLPVSEHTALHSDGEAIRCAFLGFIVISFPLFLSVVFQKKIPYPLQLVSELSASLIDDLSSIKLVSIFCY